jgi:hypothetical protein
MERLIANLSSQVRRDKLGGREHLVAPVSLIVPGVLHGSQGAGYYPQEELAKNPEAWNYVPVVIYHPQSNGVHLSARDPDVLNSQGVGVLLRTKANGKLVGEAWFDIERTRLVDERVLNDLEAGKKIELSTGLFLDKEPAGEGATFNGTPYDWIARNFRPDHLAILPDQVGACSIAQGCGVLVNQQQISSMELVLNHTNQPDTQLLAMEAILGNEFVENPFRNEHAARVQDPKLFRKDSFRRKQIAPGVSIVIGKKPSSNSTETQSYRFSASKFTAAQAKAWLKSHKIKASLEVARPTKNVLGPEICSMEKVLGAVDNEMSHDDLKVELAKALDGRYRQNEDHPYITNVFDDYFIYYHGAELYRLDYSRSDSGIKLADKPVEVMREVNYVLAK